MIKDEKIKEISEYYKKRWFNNSWFERFTGT